MLIMKGIIRILFLVANLQIIFGQLTYKAAVIEYAPIDSEPDMEVLMLENTKYFMTYIEQAKDKGADIVVFPEYGITSIKINTSQIFANPIPNPEEQIVPYLTPENYSKTLVDISGYAATKKIYVVVNLLEKEKNEDIFYNTNVAFDRDGKVIAKYRKINLFDEPGISRGNELVTFKTDFGETFGMVTCFDILFKKPAIDITAKAPNIVYPTAWFSETPFLTAISVQAGYARANGVNLLASGYTKPSNKNGGSGIYAANSTMETSIPTADSSRLVTMNVPKISSKTFVKNYHQPDISTRFGLGNLPTIDNFKTSTENMTDYVFKDLNLTSLERQYINVCQEDSCCNFEITFKNNSAKVVYKAVIRTGFRSYGVQDNYIRTCGLVACSSNENSSCGGRVKESREVEFKSISIKATHPKSAEAFYFPTTLRINLDVISNSGYSYEVTELDNQVQILMETNEEQNSVIAFGIYGRDDSVSSVGVAQVNLLLLMITSAITWLKC